MQTFLPLPSFEQSAACLDRQRLGKQRVETLQLLNAIVHGTGWINHPCTKMWTGYVPALVSYGIAMCDEWMSRGFNDSCGAQIRAFSDGPYIQENVKMPWFVGYELFHSSHRANLLRKDPVYYGQFGWTDNPILPYFWPLPRKTL